MASLSQTANNNNNGDDDDEEVVTTLAEMDQDFFQVGCLGHGGFGSVFLARKQSGRTVALKVMRLELDTVDPDESMSIFSRELEFVLKLEETTLGGQSPAIVFFEDWYTGPNHATIVMNYADGGTLADEILTHSVTEANPHPDPYTERRIAWYALQLSGALAFAHERGVAHHDVKSSNIVIDRTGGGKLLLADWGSAVDAGEESVKFTELYASPELHRAAKNGNLEGLQADKIDAFGLGCILFELLCCQKLVDLTVGEDTLGEYIDHFSVNTVLDLSCLRLPWLPASPTTQTQVGYSNSLRGLVKTLLEGNPNDRWTPSEISKPLHQDPKSPLLMPYVTAAQTPKPGAPVTIDNLQLGMFVQRGHHWNDGDADGGIGSIGVVVKLDADAGYTEVAFSVQSSPTTKTMICRIGAGNKFELQVGPTPLADDFFELTGAAKHSGIIQVEGPNNYTVGQRINSCVVVSTQPGAHLIIVAPMKQIQVAMLALNVPGPVPVRSLHPRKPIPPPDTWKPELGLMVEVTDPEERELVIEPFFGLHGGLDIQNYEIVSIKRIQLNSMWDAYSSCRESVAAENWGVINEQRLFHGTGQQHSPEMLLSSPEDFYQKCATGGMGGGSPSAIRFSSESKVGDQYSYRFSDSGPSMRQMVLSRVALGRMDDRRANQERPARPPSFGPLDFHSVQEQGASGPGFTVVNPFQAYPEFFILYRVASTASSNRRIIRARRSNRRVRAPRRPTQRSSPAVDVTPVAPTHNAAVSSPATPNMPRVPAAFSTPLAGVAHGNSMTPGSAASVAKECVVCLERHVTHILVPCGHPCLCEICSTGQGLVKLKHKCPECRRPIRETLRFYGTIVEDRNGS